MQFLDPCNDVAFKKVFGSEEHKNITISFLNAMLDYEGEYKIKTIEFLNNEQLPQMPEKKETVLDVFCIDGLGNKYIIEIQVARVKEFGKRMVYYGSKTYSMQLGKGRPYHTLTPVITLAITSFVMFPDKPEYKSIHYLLDSKTHEHDLKELGFVFVELPKFNKPEHLIDNDIDRWIYFIKEISTMDHIPAPLQEDEFEEACHVVKRMAWSEEELNWYDDMFVRETDRQTALELAVEEATARITIEAEDKIREEKRQTARNLKALGMSKEDILKVTGLTEHEWSSLIQNDN